MQKLANLAIGNKGEIRSISDIDLEQKLLEMGCTPGEQIEVVRKGESPKQGVGYLQDGTMVVIEDGGESIGEFVMIEVTNSLQTSAGRMIFANLAP